LLCLPLVGLTPGCVHTRGARKGLSGAVRATTDARFFGGVLAAQVAAAHLSTGTGADGVALTGAAAWLARWVIEARRCESPAL